MEFTPVLLIVGILLPFLLNIFRLCYLGDRLLTSASVTVDGVMQCTKNQSGPLFHKFCEMINNTATCDPFFDASETYTKPGIPGLTSDVFSGKCLFSSAKIVDLQNVNKTLESY